MSVNVADGSRSRHALGPGDTVPLARAASESGFSAAVRVQIWIYLLLWLVEGALRKWYLPGLSNPLLVVRDPVVLSIYATALAGGLFPFNRIVIAVFLLALLSFGASLLVTGNLLLTAFGVRANFLHLPLIYVMAAALRPIDVRRIGLFLLCCAVPMALIMAKQFNSGIDDWWNLGAGGGRQIISVDGRIRAAGTFSFISGPVAFFGMVAAFLVASSTLNKWFRWWLLIPAAGSTMLGAAVAGSRSLLVILLIVVVFFLIGCARYPRAIRQLGFTFGGAIIAFLMVSGLEVYQAGRAVTSDRAIGATENEGGLGGMVNRAMEPLLITSDKLSGMELLGRGIGSGTAAASALVDKSTQPIWSENEWDRVLAESGPILGIAYLLLRTVITISAFVASLGVTRTGNLLAIALFGAGGAGMLTGQFGQPTSQGAATISIGLCLAALSLRHSDLKTAPAESAGEEGEIAIVESDSGGIVATPVRRGRAQYAASLHEKKDEFEG